MRSALLAGLILVAAPAAGFAQSGPYLATVTDPEVRLRAGPSDRFPETASLKKGDTVLVYEEESGWLGVQAPAGQMHWTSWVQMQFVDFNPQKRTPQTVMVTEDTTLRPGQIDSAQPWVHIQRTKLPAGSALTVIGDKVSFDGKTWYPVLPPAGDFRYLPKSAVRAERPVNASFTVRDGTPPGPDSAGSRPAPAGATAAIPGPGGVVPAAGSGVAAGRPVPQHPLWAQAEAAERDGKYDEAERLFFQLARVMNEPGGDHDIANLCYTRIHTLREKKRAAGGGGTSGAARPPAGDPPRTTDSASQTTGGPSTAGGSSDTPRWTGPGRLARSAVAIDGRQTYRLEDNTGTVMVYAVPAKGVDLEKLVGRKVEVYGSTYTRNGLSRPYVIAMRAESAQ